MTPILGAASSGLAIAATVHEAGGYQVEKAGTYGGDSSSTWASKADSPAGVAGRSIAAAGMEVLNAPIGAGGMMGEATADAYSVYTGQEGPKEGMRPPRGRAEADKVRQAKARPYDEAKLKDHPSLLEEMWAQIHGSEDGQAGIAKRPGRYLKP